MSDDESTVPIQSMYGILTYIYRKNQLDVGKYTIPHGSYGVLSESKESVESNKS